MSFALPVFFISVYASSQIPRMPPTLLFSEDGDSHKIQGSFNYKADSPTKVQLYLKVDPNKPTKARVKYQIKHDGDLLRSRKIDIHLGANPIKLDEPISLVEKGPYRVGFSFGKKSFEQHGIKTWTLSVMNNPYNKELELYRYLEIPLFPSLSLIIFALVLILLPKFISQGY